MPTVIVPAPYRGPTRGEGEVPVEGSTVRACLEAVERSHAGFLAQVVDGSGQVHRFVRLFVNGAPAPAGLDTPMARSDKLEIIAAIAGG